MDPVARSGRPLRTLHDELLTAGACRGQEPRRWFPPGRPARNPRGRERQTAYARRVCEGCPVTAVCLEYALRAGCEFGVWGGRTEHERRRMSLSGLPHAGVAA
jgi:WhiB family redox-sensing transcriptional regulator